MVSPKSRADIPMAFGNSRYFGAGLRSNFSRTNISFEASSGSFDRSATSDIDVEGPPMPHSPWKAYPSWQYDRLVKRHGSDKVKLIYMVRHAEGTHNVNREYKDIANLDARLTDKGRAQCQNLRNKLLGYRKKVSPSPTCSDDNDVDNKYVQGLHYLLRSHSECIQSDGQTTVVDPDPVASIAKDVCVVTSPLSRCVETALLSFDFFLSDQTEEPTDHPQRSTYPDPPVPYLAHESLRETVNYNCDRRRSISEIERDFPQVDFSNCIHEDDVLWSSLLSIDGFKMEHEQGGHLESAALHLVARRGVDAMTFLQSLPYSKVVVSTHSAFLRCLLSWGHPGGVPLMVEQKLDENGHYNQQTKILEYSCILREEVEIETGDVPFDTEELDKGLRSFERYMREDYANAELRSFCLLSK
ncbi:histidine phosphatase superfamily branch 1 protein [Nitzschia inconspicua]|uniref:Histidine phosphatase superfamily branch 1 protein n=1 Tax=Nitzschia inconspicua TaxID=303405 RepID=A0A9K3KRA6_9STRA|nr:histidine phosphatase superfamily branch 1 protein [Nitzschia inconspicua]